MGIGLAKKIVAVLFRIDSNIKIPQKTWWVSYIFIYSKQYFHVVSGWCFQSFVKWMLLFSLLVLKATKIRLRAIGSAKQPGFKPQKTCFHAQDIIFKPSTWRSDRKNFVPLIASTWGIAVFFYPPLQGNSFRVDKVELWRFPRNILIWTIDNKSCCSPGSHRMDNSDQEIP